MADKAAAQAAKARGNTAFTAGRFEEAITEFTEAIRNDPTDHVFFSNRSGAYTSLKRFDEALADAEACIKLKPDWGKGYSRKGAALHGSQKLDEAKQAFEEGLKKEPTNQQCKEGLETVEKELAAPRNPFGQIFGPAMWTKLESNPTTKGWLDNDPRFRGKMQMLASNPNMANALIQSDPQVQTALSVILGLGTEAFAGAAERGEGGDGPAGMDTSDESPKASSPPPKKPTPAPREEKKAEPPRSDMTPEEKEAAEKFAKSEAEKKKGNDAYAKKDFETALTLYNKAIEVDETNASAYLNLAAVALEKKDYDTAVNYCKKAVDTAREHKRGYDIVAKAFLRMGNTYYAQKRYAEAATAYQSSQLEVGTQAAKDGLRKATEAKTKADREAYIDPVKAQEAKARGNEHFKEGKWVEAISEYDEAIKRDPKNPALYSNRAACLQKLMDWGRALEDCETAIKIDPTFVKAYTRLGKIQHFLKQYHKALVTYDKGLAIAGEGDQKKELLEAKQQTSYAISQENRSGNVDPARAREAMKDPEIQSILKDPTINRVLQDMQENPASAQGALADVDIRSKIEKLVAAGILQIGGPRPAGSRTPGQRD